MSDKRRASNADNDLMNNKSGGKAGKKKLSPRQKKKRRRRIILAVELVILAVLGVALFVVSKLNKIHWEPLGEVKTNKLDEKTKEMLKGYSTIALFGVDSRDMEGYKSGNSDTIIVCVINNEDKSVKLMSVYRDTYLDVDGNGKFRKANYAYNKGGAQEAVNMLNRNLDLDIQDYVSVNWKALADAVDAVGGLELEVTENEAHMINDEPDCVLEFTAEAVGRSADYVQPGTQVLDGVQTVAYCRIRHDGKGDYARAGRQREVIQKLMEKAKSGGLGTINKLVDVVAPQIATNLSPTTMINLATKISSYEMKDNTGFPFLKRGDELPVVKSTIVPCTLEDNVKLMYEYLYGETDYSVSDTVKGISDKIRSTTGYTKENALDYGDEVYKGEEAEEGNQ